MLRFSQKNQRIAHKIKLVSVHIPKTAGTSFQNTLRDVYGTDHFARLDIDMDAPEEEIELDRQLWSGHRLSRRTRVVHGHFSPAQFDKYFQTTDAQYITWLRHPVERVLSNYYYLEKRLKEELDEKGNRLNILSKLQRSLVEFAAASINQNRIAKFLRGRDLEAFDFVGIQAHYEEDLAAMAKLLHWTKVTTYHHNATGTTYDVNADLRAQIAAYNQEDMLIYERALALRKRRL